MPTLSAIVTAGVVIAFGGFALLLAAVDAYTSAGPKS